ncbi:MAG: polyprenyl diphosphate synthase, partial [Acidobacteriota bacterium]|nr:polyprenyl diphosphate synthase [Acidobacteriota bacterium]
KQSTLHVAAIMDGNRRWAASLGLAPFAGHRAGAEALRGIVEAAPAFGIGVLSVYAFSSANWARPSEEVDAIMGLLALYLDDETPSLIAGGVRVSVIGRRDRLQAPLLTAIEAAETYTRDCTRLHLRLAIDYSAREEILRASQSASAEATLNQALPVDLLIRTGGEQRLSDFLLWECAYSELIFTKCMWPEFDATCLGKAMEEFHQRGRRFGA